jgi:hypothetical protein
MTWQINQTKWLGQQIIADLPKYFIVAGDMNMKISEFKIALGSTGLTELTGYNDIILHYGMNHPSWLIDQIWAHGFYYNKEQPFCESLAETFFEEGYKYITDHIKINCALLPLKD